MTLRHGSGQALRLRLNALLRVIFMVAVMMALLIITVDKLPTHGIDLYVLYQAGETFMEGGNPYAMELRFYTPPWLLMLLGPLSLVPLHLAQFGWAFMALLIWALVLRKLGIKPLGAALFMLNPFFIRGLLLGSYDWLVLAGILLPMEWGAWLLFMKPQITLSHMAWWASEHGVRQGLRVYAPVGIFVIAAIMTGFWREPMLEEMWWNMSLGMKGIPIGLSIAAMAFVKHDELLALAAMPFLAPYVGVQSWAVAMLPLARNPVLMALGVGYGWYFFWVSG